MSAPPDFALRLTGYDAIRLTGSDASAFLNGQVSAEVAAIPEGRIGLAAWCTPKGRVDFLFRVAPGKDALWLIVRADALERCVTRLKMFVLRAEVTVAGPADHGRSVYFLGDDGDTADSASDGFIDVDGRRSLHFADPATGAADGQRRFDLADVAATIPVFGEALAGAFLPQALNLEALEGLSYRKGCYPGQEVIARLHFRGENKRALATLAGTGSGTPPSPGARLRDPAAPTGAGCGVVTWAGRLAEGGLIAQAVVERDAPAELVTEQGDAFRVENTTFA